LPTKSIHLLPADYKHLATNVLEKFFPSDFDIDLNGRTLPWEAVCLIPFVDDSLFLDHEGQVKHEGLSDYDKIRNQITFSYKCYIYDKKRFEGQPKTPLNSTLTTLSGLPFNYTVMTLVEDYKDVGKHSFSSKLH
jgi:5'-3' exonuclease